MSASIVASCGADLHSPSTIGVFDQDGTMVLSFIPFVEDKQGTSVEGPGFWNSLSYRLRHMDRNAVSTAVGDIDGDAEADIIVGLGAGSRNPTRVSVYRTDGTLIEGSDFIAMSTMYGANVAAGDFDGDGIAELITAAGARNPNSPEVKVWKIDTSGGQGNWSVIDTGVHFVAFSGSYGANVTTGDINGDGTEEIIVGSGPDPRGGPNIIKVFNGDGTELGLEITDGSVVYGLSVVSADLDNDGVAKIIAGLAPKRNNPATVKIYKSDGTLMGTFDAFEGKLFGVAVSAGDLGYN